MIPFMESRETLEETEKCIDPQLWQACAGSMVQMPSENSKVYYFPQGHSEHAGGNVDFQNCPRVPECIPCSVSAVRFKADPETDEVFSCLQLAPLTGDLGNFDDDGGVGGVAVGTVVPDDQEKPASFAKTLTQSDANNGGGFSVPRYCAEMIFPRLDYSAEPPVQTILAKDVHGETWKFRHIYRGTPRRHLLTTGWSTFVNHKKLVAGDSIVFMRAENGDLCIGIRRAKRGIGSGLEVATGWNSGCRNTIELHGGFSTFLREDDSKLRTRNSNGYASGSQVNKGKVKVEDVIEAATLAANGKPFEVVYYPRASTPEFCVKASLVKAVRHIHWSMGMRFKMAFETEDSSRISWFMGTVSAAQPVDPIRWPDSLWRRLVVNWDEPDLLQNVKRVNPWQVELVSNMPPIQLIPFSPLKRSRYSQELPADGQIPLPAFPGNRILGSSNTFVYLPNNTTPAGMQGARHAQYGIPLSNLHLKKFQTVGFPMLTRASSVQQPSGASNPVVSPKPGSNENVSCLLTMGLTMENSSQVMNKSDNRKAAPFVLFGQPILTEKQISLNCSSNTTSSPGSDASKMGNTPKGSSSAACQKKTPASHCTFEGFRSELSLDTGHCKVFMESEDVGRTLDLSVLGSYEELYRKLASMFGIEISERLNHILYRDATGVVRQIGDEPFSNFMKMAKRLTIVADSSSVGK